LLIPPDVALSLSAKLFELTPIPGTKQKHAREVRLYNEVIGVFSDLLGPYRFINTDSVAECEQMLQSLLRVINAVTEKYLAADGNDVSINSCYMVPILRHEFTNDILKETSFVDRERDLGRELRAVLRLVQWANPLGNLPTTLYLPVEDHASPNYRHRLLFGAPWAFDNGKPQFVDNTLRPTRYRHPIKRWVNDGPAVPGRFFLQRQLPAAVVEELTEYFRVHQEHLMSFVSVPLPIPPEDRKVYPKEYADQPLAVLSIQANQPRLLGKGGARARLLLTALLPVLNVLIRYISRVRLGVK
jgi:hypothetical protein